MTEKNELIGLPHRILEGAARAALSLEGAGRSGLYFHVDQSTVFSQVNEVYAGKIELMDIKDALEKYPWLDYYWFKLVDRDKDEYTRMVAEEFSGGYFMRIKRGAEVTLPLQSCLLITEQNTEQRVHNIIIAEEDSKAQIVTTCVQHADIRRTAHLGITEVYVKKGAKLNNTMVHHWGTQTKVRPRSVIEIEDRGEFIDNYICLTPAHDVEMFPTAYCNGKNSKVLFNSILFVQEGSHMDIGSRAVLNGWGSSAELNTRAVCIGHSELISRATVEGNSEVCKGHLECRGLVLEENSVLEAIPILRAANKGPELTHEAAVGKLSEREITYLMSRKMDEDAAVGALVRGFLDIEIVGLPESVRKGINNVAEIVVEAS